MIREYSIIVEEKEYTFALNMKAALKCEGKFGGFADIFNGLLKGENFYTNSFKLLSCACKEKEWDYEELAEKYPVNLKELQILDKIVIEMYTSFELFKEKNDNEDKQTEKNEGTSQSMK